MWYNCPCEVNSMNLIDAKTLLERRRIPYRTVQYENETEYWHHLMPFPRMTRFISLIPVKLVTWFSVTYWGSRMYSS